MDGDTSKIKLGKKSTRRLLGYAKPYLGLFLVTFLAIAALIGLSLYQPILLGQATDVIAESSGVTEEAIKSLIVISLQYLACVVFTFVISYLQSMLLVYIGQKIIYQIRLDVFSHLHKLDISFFNENPIGRLVTRATNDVETLSDLYTSVIPNLFKSAGTLVGIVVTMLYFNLKLSLITFTAIPVILVITAVFTNILMRRWKVIRSKISALNAFVSEHVSGMRIIQIFAAENKTQKKFEERSEELRKGHLKQIMSYSIYGPSIYLLNIIATVLLIIFGSRMYLDGVITIGTIITFQRYIGRFFDPIQEFAEQLNVIQAAKVSAQRIFGLLDEEPSIKEKEDAIELDDVKGDIEFKNVWFAYKGEDWVLKDVSFKINAGESVAFVGATGAGKTTIQNLIGRYYDIQQGEILLDGINIKDIKIDSLRVKIGQMLQDVFLFTGNIESNIRLRNDDITQDELIASAQYVNADSFISKLKMQYQEPVIEGGTSLSAGQRQLISFARTLAYKPKILILDEATANIDTETELLIQDALHKIMQGRTTLIVAHRLSTIQNCDNIIVMHKGRIVEQGNHQQLLKQRGMYYKLYKLQYENGAA